MHSAILRFNMLKCMGCVEGLSPPQRSLQFFVWKRYSTALFTFAAICRRPSVCRLSVTFVRPTQAIEIFG